MLACANFNYKSLFQLYFCSVSFLNLVEEGFFLYFFYSYFRAVWGPSGGYLGTIRKVKRRFSYG